MDVQEAVIEDMKARRAWAMEKYGVPLTPYMDDRDPILEAYEEALDLCMYLKRALLENGGG